MVILFQFRLTAAPDRCGRGAALAAAVAERIKNPPPPEDDVEDAASGEEPKPEADAGSSDKSESVASAVQFSLSAEDSKSDVEKK